MKIEDESIHILTDRYSTLKALNIISDDNSVVELDLGCGKGDFSTALAKSYPERTVLAADVMLGRLRKLVRRNCRENIDNIFALRVEIRQLIYYMLPDSCLDRVHMLCPDPWPKTRHRKHRVLCSDFLGQLSRVLKENGVFHFSTDDERYFHTTVHLINDSGLFSRDDSCLADVEDVKTSFEIRWNSQGLTVHHAAWMNPKTACESVNP